MRPLIIANWKMNPHTLGKAKRLFNSVRRGIRDIKNISVVICPPFLYLPFLINLSGGRKKNRPIAFGAQDLFWEKEGAFTGEVSPVMLKDLGCQYVIIGHSERRRYFGETDKIINKKVKAALAAGLTPILCIGETEKERKMGKAQKVLKKQLQSALRDTKYQIQDTKYFVVAYEPVWAIGAGKPCDYNDAKIANETIRAILIKLFGKPISKGNLPILYGGSVNSGNARGYIKTAQMSGLLVGGASLDPAEFIQIIKTVR